VGGEVSTSSRALTHKDLRKMWEFNQQLPERVFGEKLVHDEHTYTWSGPNCRKMMQAIYTLAFQCLLRVDEVLSLQAHYITVLDEEEGKIEVNLLFRKTNQYRGKKIVSNELFWKTRY
jgi:integrase